MKRFFFGLLMVILAVLTMAALTTPVKSQEPPEHSQTTAEPTYSALRNVQDETEDYENQKISDALYASGYFRNDIPMDDDAQAFLRSACEETGVPYELALAVIWKETGYRNVTGDDGASIGYMQVQERWHGDRMARLGVTDLADPYSNFRVGCDYLAELLGKYPLEEALTAYNSGGPGQSEYAKAVVEHLEMLS